VIIRKYLLFGMTLFFSGAAFAASGASTCDVQINQTMVPMSIDNSVGTPLCMEDYFKVRDMAFKSLTGDPTGARYLTNDLESISFNDMFTFSLPGRENIPLGEKGRLELIVNTLTQFKASLTNGVGTCELKIYGDGKELSIGDFKKYDRTEEGQPGTRLTLNDHEVKKQSWELICPTIKKGETYVAKKGTYFYIFVDVYENQGDKNLNGHFSKFLFSFLL
jgi:hypothetical protein